MRESQRSGEGEMARSQASKWTLGLAIFGSALSVFGSVLATLGFALAFVTALFTVYQWRAGQSQTRINAAVELSKTYLIDPEIPRRYALFVDSKAEPIPGSLDTHLRARSYLDLLNYIAHLANENLIDDRYVNGRIKCDIYWMVKDAQLPPGYQPGQAMAKYVKDGKATGCPN